MQPKSRTRLAVTNSSVPRVGPSVNGAHGAREAKTFIVALTPRDAAIVPARLRMPNV
jgi:hypothetical protein